VSRGRPAKPTDLKVLHGDRKDRVNRAEPRPGGEIVAPGWMSDEARANWDRLAPDRIRKGVLTSWDVEAFAAFCEALVLIQQGVREASGPMVPGCASPMSRFKDAVSIASSLGSRFGWTPSDRTKLTVGEAKRDPTADLLSG